MQEYFEIGQIVNTFGIKGMVKIMPYTDNINRFDDLKKVYVVIKQTKKQYEVEEVKYHKGILGTLEDIFNTGSNDIYVVKTEDHKQILLPAIQDVIKEILLEKNKIIVHITPGLE